AAGARVALPRAIPDPPLETPVIDLRSLAPESADSWIVVKGPTVASAFDRPELKAMLRDAGIKHHGFYRQRSQLPLSIARQAGLLQTFTSDDRMQSRGGR